MLGRVDAVEVDRVRVRGAVDEGDAQPLALTAAQRRAGDAAVVRPGGERDARRDLDLLVAGDQRPLAQDPPAREPARRTPVEVAQQLVWVEAVAPAVNGVAVAEARVTVGERVGSVAGVDVRAGRLGLVVPRMGVGNRSVQQGAGAQRRERSGQQLATSERCHG